MRRIKYIILLLIIAAVSANAAEWRSYLSYSNPEHIVPTDKFIYVVGNNSLYSYNRNDHSIHTYSKSDLLSDVEIKFIAWSKAVKKLVIIYANGNIDLLGNNGTDIYNISDYYRKSTTDDKTINNILVHENLLFLATNFGIVKLDIRKNEIMETYRLNKAITKVDVVDNKIIGLCGINMYVGDMKKNLLDVSMWAVERNNHNFPNRAEIASSADSLIVKTIKIEGPRNNQISRLKFFDNRLIVAAGGHIDGKQYRIEIPATMQELSGNEWFFYDDYEPAAQIRFTREVMDIAIDPKDYKHIFVATNGNGIYEFQNGRQVHNYTDVNTDVIKSATTSSNYVLTAGVCFYKDDLYFLNNQTSSALLRLNKDKEVEHLRHDELFGLSGDNNLSWGFMCRTILDSRNLMWFVNNNHLTPALYCYHPETDKIVRFDTFVNQDGTTIADLNFVRCVVEDFEHNLWVGTEQGPLMLTPSLMEDNSAGFIQVKVPRNDGTNYADYLLAGVDITCIAVDPAGRKWFGTNGNGVYLISENNIEQLAHFTAENSCLLSNDIRDIAINDKTGEVFFASNSGLCSYISDATQAFDEMKKENIWAYPNPVTADYNGDITIVGLSMNATITITTSSGHIVAKGKSNGGSFTWNGCDSSGKRVASGIYMVHTATADGKSGVVTKIAVIK